MERTNTLQELAIPCHPSVWYEGLLTRRVGV
jgi:hypothetical protein